MSSWVLNKSTARYSKTFLGNLCRHFTVLTINKRWFFYAGMVFPAFQCVPVAFASVIGQHWEVSVSISLFLTIRDLYALIWSPPKLLQAEEFQLSQPLLYVRDTSDLSSSSCSSVFSSPFYWRPQNWSLSFFFPPFSLNAALALVFLSPTPFLDSISLLLTGHRSLLLPLSFCFSMFEFYQEFILTDLAPPLISCMSG